MQADASGPLALLRRHALLKVAPDSWAAALAGDSSLVGCSLLRDWAARQWPVVVRRYAPDESRAAVPVAVPLPPDHQPRRVALSLPPAAVDGRDDAPFLADIAVPGPWRDACEAILVLGAECRLEPRVFGSLMWQVKTGMAYLTARSDLDLLWPLPPPRFEERLRSGLADIEAESGVRIDGELVDSDGAAVHWREFSSGAPEVLVKTMDGAELRSRDAWLASSRSTA